jgi:long-chain acyl-CoA synthetase
MLCVFAPLKNVFGLSRVRSALTGVEPISPDILCFFRAIGVDLKLCYCLAESGGCAAICSDAHQWNVIRESLNTEVKLDRRHRIYVRRHEEWFATGDLGESRPEGIQIVGREAPPGNNIKIPRNSALVESILKSSTYIKDACVFGDCVELAALLTIDKDLVGSWADKKTISHTSYEDLATHRSVQELVRQELNVINKKLKSFQINSEVTRFLILPREFDKAAGELTRYRTVCRPVILAHLNNFIEALMQENVKVQFREKEIPVVAVG